MTLKYHAIKEGLKEIFELCAVLDRLDEFYQKIFFMGIKQNYLTQIRRLKFKSAFTFI